MDFYLIVMTLIFAVYRNQLIRDYKYKSDTILLNREKEIIRKEFEVRQKWLNGPNADLNFDVQGSIREGE